MVTERTRQDGCAGSDHGWRSIRLRQGMYAGFLAGLACLPGCQDGARATPGTTSRSTADPVWIELQPGLRIDPSRRELVLEAEVCLVDGWLEQVACSPGTREHESILVITVPPSSVHAGLLAAGFEPGRPGSWRRVDGQLHHVAPTGSEVEILVQPIGSADWIPVRRWIRGPDGSQPEGPWIFGGSTMRDPSGIPAGISRYEADTSGSIIGLVTFGDETLGFHEVIPDEVVVAPEEWRVRSEEVPPVGSVVQVLVRPLNGGR